MSHIKTAYEAGRKAALEKFAAVPGPVKQYRRALQAMASKDFAVHLGKADKVLESGVLQRGTVNMASPEGISEVYFGKGLPAIEHTPGQRAMLMPVSKVLSHAENAPVPGSEHLVGYVKPRVVREAGYMQRYYSNPALGATPDWIMTPHDVPVTRGDYAVMPSAELKAHADAFKNTRARPMASEALSSALDTLYPRRRKRL